MELNGIGMKEIPLPQFLRRVSPMTLASGSSYLDGPPPKLFFLGRRPFLIANSDLFDRGTAGIGFSLGAVHVFFFPSFNFAPPPFPTALHDKG